MSKNGGFEKQKRLLVFRCQNGRPEMIKKNVFALYVLLFKRFWWSGKRNENGGPNGAPKASKFKPLVSKV